MQNETYCKNLPIQCFIIGSTRQLKPGGKKLVFHPKDWSGNPVQLFFLQL